MRLLSSRPARLLAGLGAVLTLGAVGAGPAAAADFGTVPVSGPGRAGSGLTVRDVTVGRQDGYDRVVFTAVAGLPKWEVRYVPSVSQDGSGKPVPLDGDADLLVVLRGTDWTGRPSVQKALSPGFPGLRQVAGAGEFEGVLTYGIGQATKAGFRAFALTGPDRLVVDVAQPATESSSTPTTGATTGVPTPPPVASGTEATPASSTASGSPAAVTGADSDGLGSTELIAIGGIVAVIGAGIIFLALRTGRRS